MIVCYINGKPAFPSTSSSIKITRENPLIKDRDAYTQEVSFDLAVKENRDVFGSIDRIDVAKKVTAYDNCRLYANNHLVMCGKGTVTSVSDTSVKIQIKSGISTNEFSEYEDVYIDKQPFLEIWDKSKNAFVAGTYTTTIHGNSVTVFNLAPVYDETNDVVFNRRSYWQRTDKQWSYCRLSPMAAQPGFYYVLWQLFKDLGYTLQKSFLDESPWRYLSIVNVTPASTIGKSLPHWTVAKFLKEVRHLFNIGFSFDERAKTVTVISADNMESSVFECVDEFSTDYDEDGLEHFGASNVKYNLSGSAEWETPDIEEEKLSSLTVKEYGTLAEVASDVENMTEQEKLTTLFHVGGWEYVYIQKTEDDDGNVTYDYKEVGKLQHLARESGSENTVELNIVPSAHARVEFNASVWFRNAAGKLKAVQTKQGAYMPSTTSELELDKYTKVDTYSDYVTVQDVIEDGTENKENDADRMELFFSVPNSEETSNITVDDETLGTLVFSQGLNTSDIPKTITYPETNTGGWYVNTLGSFSFYTPVVNGSRLYDAPYIGQYHSTEKIIENHEQIVIKFLIEEGNLPDPTHIFIFRNKRFLCDKLEITVKNDGVDPIATGYFYELSD